MLRASAADFVRVDFRMLTLMMLVVATIGAPTDGGQAENAVGWREYWELKLPGTEPPTALSELASPLNSSREIENSFICISRARYSFCFCTRLAMRVCAAANVSVGPPASTCIFHFFYEYHKNCKPGPQPTYHQAFLSAPPNNAFFNSSYLLYNINNSISLPPLSDSLMIHGATFLPRALADMLPFQNSKLAEALSLLHIPASSTMATSMQETLEFCQASPQNEESLQCVTSIESMVDFASSHLGSHAMVLTPTLQAEDVPRSEAKIDKIVNMTSSLEESTGTCHNLVYPYLVYGCHVTRGSSVLRVSFEGIRGEATVICHHNTSMWNPTHPAFAQLQASPGDGEEICHWIPRHHFVWMSSPSSDCSDSL